MATCKDCLHYKICEYVSFVGKTCKDFKDRSNYVEVVHGHWIKEHLLGCEPYYLCSVCGKLHDQDYNFCNNCGADMR